jgi:hypothetical protein
MRNRFGQAIAGLREAVGIEDWADQRCQQPVLIAAGVAETVSEEVALMPTSA